MTSIKWHIGCSGFHYREWKGIFYPEGMAQKKWFEFYGMQFNTVELNATFYRFPRLTTLERWHEVSPPDFSFSVKAPRLVTHYRQFNNCETLLTDFYGTVQNGLKEKLGPVLFQLPPSFAYSAANLDRIVENIHTGADNVVEFRNPGWWKKEVYETLKIKKIIFSGISYPLLPETVVVNNSKIYYRFHGIPKLYYSGYGDDVLKKTADTILKNKRVKEVYLYFNNTASAAAIENAMWIKKYVDHNSLQERKRQR